jgi:hypothetical protein
MHTSIFLVLIFVCSSLAAEKEQWCAETANIDTLVLELQNKRTKALGKAERQEDEAVRWQFRGGQFNETRQAYERAAAARKEAENYQTQIDQLEAQKRRILQKHGSCP